MRALMTAAAAWTMDGAPLSGGQNRVDLAYSGVQPEWARRAPVQRQQQGSSHNRGWQARCGGFSATWPRRRLDQGSTPCPTSWAVPTSDAGWTTRSQAQSGFNPLLGHVPDRGLPIVRAPPRPPSSPSNPESLRVAWISHSDINPWCSPGR